MKAARRQPDSDDDLRSGIIRVVEAVGLVESESATIPAPRANERKIHEAAEDRVRALGVPDRDQISLLHEEERWRMLNLGRQPHEAAHCGHCPPDPHLPAGARGSTGTVPGGAPR